MIHQSIFIYRFLILFHATSLICHFTYQSGSFNLLLYLFSKINTYLPPNTKLHVNPVLQSVSNKMYGIKNQANAVLGMINKTSVNQVRPFCNGFNFHSVQKRFSFIKSRSNFFRQNWKDSQRHKKPIHLNHLIRSFQNENFERITVLFTRNGLWYTNGWIFCC